MSTATATADTVAIDNRKPLQAEVLPPAVIRRGIQESQWRMLFNLFPGAKPDSALMVWDYCVARKLDPMKKPCHIVPMDYKDPNGQWQKRDVVMPGIYEYRITAQRTGLYLGHTKPEFGPLETLAGVQAPEWCSMTMFRWNEKAQRQIDFPVTVYFAEVVATNRDGNANTRWTKAPRQMLTKCTEAAGLREAFPEEFGGEPTAEEMDGQPPIDVEVSVRDIPQPAQRKSQQTASPEPATAPVPPAPPSPSPAVTAPAADPPPNVGTIASVDERQGGTLITLSTGFKCATRNADFITAAKGLKTSGARVELGTRAAAKAGNVAVLEEILPADGEA